MTHLANGVEVEGVREHALVFAVGLLDGSDWDGARWIAFEELPDSLRVVPGQEFNKIKIGDRKIIREYTGLGK